MFLNHGQRISTNTSKWNLLSSVPTLELIQLHALIWGMHTKQKIVAWLHHICKSHEQQWVDAHGCNRTKVPNTSSPTDLELPEMTRWHIKEHTPWLSIEYIHKNTIVLTLYIQTWAHPTTMNKTDVPLFLLNEPIARSVNIPPVIFSEIISGGFCVSASPCDMTNTVHYCTHKAGQNPLKWSFNGLGKKDKIRILLETPCGLILIHKPYNKKTKFEQRKRGKFQQWNCNKFSRWDRSKSNYHSSIFAEIDQVILSAPFACCN